MDLDDTDSAIIAQLQLDARQSNRELARRVGIAPSTCLERVRGLHERGVITGYHARLDLSKIGRSVQAIVAAQVRPSSRTVIDSFRDWAVPRPEVLEVLVVAGGDDFLIRVAVQDNERLHGFLIDHLAKRKEVVSFRTLVVFQHSATTAITPLSTMT
ncbi:Lrp/AsnC family transcriptional regulator [Herbidospora cretacea]|uniref:Lrp/AsnC family transcriptional regulator n=1 Tax=Herbidospora cretacea TaxID=28444 RepID=UPI000ACFFAB2|nr:Lrp/AsnC family transcriptional regulator [Herbidospora cretacea]